MRSPAPLASTGIGRLLLAALLVFTAACGGTSPTEPGVDPEPKPDTVALEEPVTSASGARYFDHTEFGAPVDATPDDELLLDKLTHTLSYSCADGRPNWVRWNLNASHFGPAPRQDRFLPDPEIPAGCPVITHDTYTHSGYSRGHMVRSEEHTKSDAENRLTFLMTNIVPQLQDLNGGPWLDLE